MTIRYTHLHLHSEYSLVDSTIRIKAMVAACAQAVSMIQAPRRCIEVGCSGLSGITRVVDR